MKKTYMNPEIIIVKVTTNRFVATSIDVNSNGDAVDAGSAAGRRYDGGWDDEDDNTEE
jgi:hypothetical protein